MRSVEIFKRKTGQTLAMVLMIKQGLEKNEPTHLLTKEKNVDRILKMLEDHGVNAIAEPIYFTSNLKAIWNTMGEITGWTQPPKKQTGFKIRRYDKEH